MIEFRPMTTKSEWEDIKKDLDLVLTEDTKGIVGYKGEEIVCAAIFDGWTVSSVSVHQMIRDPFCLKHGFFEEVANYVYVTADRAIMYGLVPSSNERALKLDAHIGFKEVARLKDAVNQGEDLIILELRKEDCRFLPEEVRNGKEISASAA